MKKLHLIAFAAVAAFAGCLFGSQHFKHEFTDIKGWQVRDGIEVKIEDGAALVSKKGLFFRRVAQDPGKKYNVKVVGGGEGYVKVGNDVIKLDFGDSGEFSKNFKLAFDARADMWVGFQPKPGSVLKIKSVEITPLPDPEGWVRHDRKALLANEPSPKTVRGVNAGALDEKKAALIKQYKASAVVVNFSGAGDAPSLVKQVDIALASGLRPIVKLDKSADPAADMKAAKAALGDRLEKIYAFIPAEYGADRDKFNALVKQLRADFPKSWFVYVAKPADYPNLNPIDDLKIIYSARYRAAARLDAVKLFKNATPAPFMAIGGANLANEFEARPISWVIESQPKNLAKNLEIAERPLGKGGTKQEQLESLKKTFLKNRKDGDFSFAFATDTHYHSSPDKTKKLSTSADHMRDMAKVAKELKLSFVANGGDMVNGARPKDESLKDIREIVGAMAESGLPVLITIGNHDDGVFWALKTFKKSDLSQVVTGAEWHDACVAPALKKGAVGDKNFDKANYFYMDFPEAKIRFINMAVSENPMTLNKKGRFAIDSCGLYAISQRQLEWLATQALDFSGKPDAKEWAVIFMSHCRLSDMKLFMGVVEAFTKGSSFSGETKTGHFPAKISCDFTAQGPIPVVLNIAGHVHTDNLAHTKLGYLGATMMNDCNRSRIFERVPGQANDAAWTIITLNRKENRATFLRFGAGSDMEAPLIKAPSGKKPPRRAR